MIILPPYLLHQNSVRFLILFVNNHYLFAHTEVMKNKFIFCGIIGWCLEIFWTGIHSLSKGRKDLMGQSSILMFPIYGCAAIIAPLSRLYHKCNVFIRGFIYMVHIFLGEYVFGSILKKRNMCPWDYSNTKYHVNGLIRLDYAPVWFITGLIYEKLLRRLPMKKAA